MRYWLLPLCLASALPGNGQTYTFSTISSILGFENNTQAGVFPAGWTGDQTAIFTDDQVVHHGKYSARVQRTTSSPGTYSTLTQSVPYDFPGNNFALCGSIRTHSASYVQSAAGTKGLIIDIRNYPSQFVVFTLGDLLAARPRNSVRFTFGDISTPGAFHWKPPAFLTPQQPHYNGKIVILVAEVTQSQAEYTAMTFRQAPGATVIGSTTAGADGDVSGIVFPGGLSTYFSGIGVFYPDGSPTQRVGIVPDIVVTPTIAGLQAGRDEVLEAAIKLIEGSARPRPHPTHPTSR